MAPFLETIKSFADVPITDKGIDTLTFLEASDHVTRLFGLISNPAFTAVLTDINGNITKVRTRYLAQPTESTTLELLTLNEQPEAKHLATEGLLWLLRGLSFAHQSLHITQNDPDIGLDAAFIKAYEGSLKQYHNFIVRNIFWLAMKACPYRNEFYAKLAMDPDGRASVAADSVDDDLNRWLEGLGGIITQMGKVYKERGYEEI